MNLNGLPADLAEFVQQELASGTYQSEDELVTEAVRLLQEHASHRDDLYPNNGSQTDAAPQTPDDYVWAIAQAVETGEAGLARQLAMDGAARYPEHAELQKSARILAPPTGRRVPRTHHVSVRANRDWLKAHWRDYAGQWIALHNGHLRDASPSYDELIVRVGDTTDVLVTKLPACP